MRHIDVHCHLDGGHYGDLDALINKVAAAGVEKLVCAGVDAETSEFGRDMSEKYPQVYFTAGFHPTELSKYKAGDEKRICDLLNHPKCVAVGEIGLDYHYPDTDRAAQEKAFVSQLETAAKFGLPVVVHSRDCAEDMLRLLHKNEYVFGCGVLLHCYSHSAEIAAELERMGAYFSFGGTCTYSGSKKAARTLANLLEQRVLTETDSPYLAPASRRGEFPNTPESIPEICARIASLKDTDVESMSMRIWENAHTLFKKLKNT